MNTLTLHDDRYFDAEPTKRRIARELYDETKSLPIVGPHGHVQPRLLAENEPFPEPSTLIIVPDHYIFRMLYSQGVRLEKLGIPTRDGTPVEEDPRAIWQRFADHYYLFRGTPTGAWLDYEFYNLFGVREKLTSTSAIRIYNLIDERLKEDSFRPRALYDEFDIEVLCTTDAATDSLQYHQSIQESDWDADIRPTFRPDALFRIASTDWQEHLSDLQNVSDRDISAFDEFVHALEDRRAFFKKMGAVATDHAALSPFTTRLSDQNVENIFQRALRGEASEEDERVFNAHMLMEMARMSVDDGLVMQLHPGSYRNHNSHIFNRFGPDMGADIPLQTEYTKNLHPLLNAYGNEPKFTLVLFTLDESTYSRELAPLAGHYPAVKLGPAWWFHDSIQGMLRYRYSTTETAGIYNTVGFNDDTRAFCSIPSRHDLSRRVDANFLAHLVSTHVIDMADAHEMAEALAYGLAKEAYGLREMQDVS